MTVERWDPRAAAAGLSEANLARLLAAAREADDGAAMPPELAEQLAGLARHRPAEGVDWSAAAGSLADADLLALIRLVTVAEARYPAWKAGDASPVIPLARELRRRERYPAELTSWIRGHSDNRFLPYGSLMDRL